MSKAAEESARMLHKFLELTFDISEFARMPVWKQMLIDKKKKDKATEFEGLI